MAKNIILIIVILITILVIYQKFFHLTPTGTINLKIKNKDYQLETALTDAQKSYGLMKRSSICANCGMIFVFGSESNQMFWMKNTLIPLDIIFLDKTGKVINIETAYPEPGVSDFKLKLYKSTAPAQYVIELNAFDCQKLNLHSGDQIQLPQF